MKRLEENIALYKKQAEQILNSENICKVYDGDTLLNDTIKANITNQSYEFAGFYEDILEIFDKSKDKKAVQEMFYEFTGKEFSEFLNKAIEEQKKTLENRKVRFY